MTTRLTPLEHLEVPAAGQLDALVDDVWRRVGSGLDGRWPPWGLPTLATASAHGPRARVLALRAADPLARRFVFHTDGRSDKVREIAQDPRASIVFWDPADGIEARFTGIAALHRVDDIAAAAWQRVSPLRRLASRSVAAPGVALNGPCRFDALPSQPDRDGGYDNFVVVHVVVDHLDWLWVGADDMRRASFDWSGTAWIGTWTAP